MCGYKRNSWLKIDGDDEQMGGNCAHLLCNLSALLTLDTDAVEPLCAYLLAPSKETTLNYLQAVFWDYPELANPDTLRQYLQDDGDSKMRRWLLQRFLEYGRVVDTLSFFSLAMIAQALPGLKLRPYTTRKWQRMLEVYGQSSRE